MNKKRFVPPLPHINPPDKKTIESLKDFDHKAFKKSDAYKKYVKPTLDREKQQRKNSHKIWWKNNWINITTLIIAVLTLIATIVFGLIQVLH